MNAVWYLGGIGAGAAIGWLAAKLNALGFAPFVLLPIATGLILGFALLRFGRALQISFRHAIAGAILFALVAVLSEHTWLYQGFRRQWQAEREANPQVAMFRPPEPWSPSEYFQREASATRIALWCLDAALVVAGSVIVVAFNREKFVVADDAKPPTPET